jgi:hypothetical protein
MGEIKDLSTMKKQTFIPKRISKIENQENKHNEIHPKGGFFLLSRYLYIKNNL